jgi:PIN domain nuclease of toxin-antitoxin system
MRILLDSHVFVWAKCAPERLGDKARAAIIDPENEAFVSVASAWELWIKHTKRPIPGFASVLNGGARGFLSAAQRSGIEILDLTLEHVAAAAELPQIHRDPFDRMLIAQAIVERLTVITGDGVFRRYPRLSVLGD